MTLGFCVALWFLSSLSITCFIAPRFVLLALFVTLAFPVPNSFLLFFFVSFTSSFSFQCFVVLHVIFVSCTCSSSFVPHTRSHSGLSVRSLTTYILETSWPCCDPQVQEIQKNLHFLKSKQIAGYEMSWTNLLCKDCTFCSLNLSSSDILSFSSVTFSSLLQKEENHTLSNIVRNLYIHQRFR